MLLVLYGGQAFPMRNDSNRGSVKSTVSSSGARQLLALDAKSTNLSIYSAESLLSTLFSAQGARSTSSVCETRPGGLQETTCFSSSVPSELCVSWWNWLLLQSGASLHSSLTWASDLYKEGKKDQTICWKLELQAKVDPVLLIHVSPSKPCSLWKLKK